jgi:hypothetical protein
LLKYLVLILTLPIIACNSEVSVSLEDENIIQEKDRPNDETIIEDENGWKDFDYNIYIGVQDLSLDDFIIQLNYNTALSPATALTYIDHAEITVDGNLRILSMDKDGNILAGGSAEVTPPLYDKNYSLIKTTAPTGEIDPIRDSHAICALPNGNYIIAEGADNTGNIVNEYDQDDNFVREVYTTVKGDHGSITQCYALDNETLIWIETGTWNWTNSNLMRMKLIGNNWSPEQTLDSATLGLSAGSNFWNFGIHSDGHVYFSPGRRDGGRFNKLLKCPIDNFSSSACSQFGDDIPISGSNYLTWGRGVVQIPGSNDMLVFISQEVFHLNYNTGVYTSILDLTTVFASLDVVRSVILAPK